MSPQINEKRYTMNYDIVYAHSQPPAIPFKECVVVFWVWAKSDLALHVEVSFHYETDLRSLQF